MRQLQDERRVRVLARRDIDGPTVRDNDAAGDKEP